MKEQTIAACSAGATEQLGPEGRLVEAPQQEALEGEPVVKSKDCEDSVTSETQRAPVNAPTQDLDTVFTTLGASADCASAGMLAQLAQASQEENEEKRPEPMGKHDGDKDTAAPGVTQARTTAPTESLNQTAACAGANALAQPAEALQREAPVELVGACAGQEILAVHEAGLARIAEPAEGLWATGTREGSAAKSAEAAAGLGAGGARARAAAVQACAAPPGQPVRSSRSEGPDSALAKEASRLEGAAEGRPSECGNLEDSAEPGAKRARTAVPAAGLDVFEVHAGAATVRACAALPGPPAQALQNEESAELALPAWPAEAPEREGEAEGHSGKCGDGLEGSAEPKAKREWAVAPAVSLDAIEAHLGAAAKRARLALLGQPARGPQDEEEDSVRLLELDHACRDAEQKHRAVEAQCRAEQASLVMAKASLRALEAAQEEALEAERKAGPALEEFERAAAEEMSACSALAQEARAVVARAEAADTTELNTADAEPSMAAVCQRLCAARQRCTELEAERSHAEERRDECRARLAALERQLEEERLRMEAEAAARTAKARAAELQRDVEALEAENALLEAAVSADGADKVCAPPESAAPEASAAAEGVAKGAVGSGSKEGAAAEASAAAEEVAKGSDVGGNRKDGAAAEECLAALEKRAAELQRLCEEGDRLVSALQAKCVAASVRGPPSTVAPPRATAAPALDVAGPSPSLGARAPQRLLVSSDGAPELAGEYRLLPGGANGRPAFRAAGSRAAFLFWTPRNGGCWVFSPDLLGTDVVLARSLQLASTALPDMLMAGSWTRGAWGARGAGLRVVILRV